MTPQLKMAQTWAMPSKNTYTIGPIKKLLEEEVRGFSIDPFANNSKIANVTNDINSEHLAFLQHDAFEFLKCHKYGEVDTVVFDPPYSPRQVSECYKAAGVKVDNMMTNAKFWKFLRDEVARIVPIGGKVISFGWNSMGIGKTRGFEKTRILLVSHGGNHNDTIVTVETKVRGEVTPSYYWKFLEIGEDILRLPRFSLEESFVVKGVFPQ